MATPYRFGGSKDAGLRNSFRMVSPKHLSECVRPSIRINPLTIFYAFKQSESDRGPDEDAPSTGINRVGDDAGGACFELNFV